MFKNPERDCRLCPRLVVQRNELRDTEPDWFNAPVPAFGGLDAKLLIVGLAPGMRGANRTGRPFTGDYAGDLLYATALEFGFARGNYDARADDGLTLVQCRITNAVRCLPPENKPIGAEVAACQPFLRAEIAAMTQLKVILTLGVLAHQATIRATGLRQKDYAFGHGSRHNLPAGPVLADSYHCSRYNTNTRRLTEDMFRDVFRELRRLVDA